MLPKCRRQQPEHEMKVSLHLLPTSWQNKSINQNAVSNSCQRQNAKRGACSKLKENKKHVVLKKGTAYLMNLAIVMRTLFVEQMEF